MKVFSIHGDLLVRNTAISLLGSVLPLVAAFFTTPFLIRHLGVERFGVLSLAWMILWYSTYFDLGLTRATAKFVADAIGKNEQERVPALVWTSLTAQTLLGLVAAAAIVGATPLLTGRVLRISTALTGETRMAFFLVGAMIPFFLGANVLSAVLASAQRFDLVNVVKIPANSLIFLLSAGGAYCGYRLPGIMLLLLISRVVTTLVLLSICGGVFPGLAQIHFLERASLTALLSFGGWVTLCNVLIPLLVNTDRFVIGAIVSMAAVAYYSVPFDVAMRLQIIPGVLGGVLLPAFTVIAAQNRERLARLYSRSLKITLLLMGPATLLVAAFARDFLRTWIGSDFAAQSTQTLQVLTMGMLLSALSQVPANLLDGVGRPDLRAKTFLGYVLPYLALLWFMVARLGILGAALAWTIRAGLELALFSVVVANHLSLSHRAIAQNGLSKAAMVYGALVAIVLGLKGALPVGVLLQSIVSGLAMVAFSLVIWRFVLDGSDRRSLFAVLGG